MGRINVNQVLNESSKIEELPERIGLRKNVKLGNYKNRGHWDYSLGYHGDKWYGIARSIQRGCIGKNWDEVVTKIREKLPKGFEQEHPWITERPDIMIQDSVDGKWYWQSPNGDLIGQGYDTPRELKHASIKHYRRTGMYYLDSQNRLKVLPRRPEVHKTGPTKSEKRKEDSTQKIVDYLRSKADYFKRAHKYNSNHGTPWYELKNSEGYHIRPKVTFNHPTLVDVVKRYDKATDSWIETGETRPKSITLGVEDFKHWCDKHDKTYLLIIDGHYHTNMKWSLKQ